MDNNIITIPNINEFTQQIIQGNLILTRINPSISEFELFQKNLLGSKIVSCKINYEIFNIKKYKKLLLYFYSITDKQTILRNTILTISQEQLYERGFKFYDNLGLSIRGTDARTTLKEIVNMVKINKIDLELKIKLINDTVICFKI